MICEICKAESKTSRVYGQGGSYMTLLNCTPFYDEQGRHHYHDSNTTTDNFECSNGHRWTVKSTGSCWCGWPNEQKPSTSTSINEATALANSDLATTEQGIRALRTENERLRVALEKSMKINPYGSIENADARDTALRALGFDAVDPDTLGTLPRLRKEKP